MSLLQDPISALRQINWYLDHQGIESFPGAFEIAAGNLSRQIVEQILFILCFWAKVPQQKYIRKDRKLHVAARLLQALDESLPGKSITYWQNARNSGPRIRKFAKRPSTLRRWVHELNEAAHFSTHFRTINTLWLKQFATEASELFDEDDKYLIVAAINHLFSRGFVEAHLSSDISNKPGLYTTCVVRPKMITRSETGTLKCKSPDIPIQVISSQEIPRGRWPRKAVVIVQGMRMSIGARFVLRDGTPVNIASFNAILSSVATSEHQLRYLIGHLRRLGYKVERQVITDKTGQSTIRINILSETASKVCARDDMSECSTRK